MTTLAKHQIENSTSATKSPWKHVIEFGQNLVALNKQRANLAKLRNHFRLGSNSIHTIGPTQIDLILAYSSHVAPHDAGRVKNTKSIQR
jgi:hypothetical protein